MKAVVQRVSRAVVRVDGNVIGEIGRGLLVLLGIGKTDTGDDVGWMINKLLSLRVFPDDDKNMNRSVNDISGEILVVSQFTLYGDARKGTRPSFSDAMPPADAEKFYANFMASLRKATSLKVAEGRFAAMMDVELINDGPVTIILESPVERASSPFNSADSVERAPSPFNPKSNQPDGLEARSTPFTPFDPSVAVVEHHRNLPHWEQAGRTYFVTFRLADSLPQDTPRQWMAERELWLRTHPEPWTDEQQTEHRKLFTERLEQWLDTGHGNCSLRRPDIAALVEQSLRHFDGERYELGAFVIMPNHVHALVTPWGDWTLEQILHSWKSFTANQANRLLKRQGSFWQAEYFDHLVRNEDTLHRFEEYICQNPAKAHLHENEYILGL